MPPRPISFETVRTMGLRLPGVEAGTAYGSPALKLRGKLMACMAAHRSAEPHTLVVCIDFAQRDAMIAEDPGTYYLKEHYVGYPCVLVRLSRVHRDAIADLLSAAWRFIDAKYARPKTKRTPRRPARARR
jgi:hypothetical protein